MSGWDYNPNPGMLSTHMPHSIRNQDGCSLGKDRLLLIGLKGAIHVISIQGHAPKQSQREWGHIRALRYFHILKDRCVLAVSNSLGS